MARQTGQKETSKGICRFCQSEFAKSKMTQHLKSCKARSADKTGQEGHEQRLFHLFVEGAYRPSYWMHLEVPAAATLSDLDDFLRDIWLECCDHLSEFEIGDASYSSHPEDDWGMGMSFGGPVLVNKDEDEDEDSEDEEDSQDLPSMQEMAQEISKRFSSEFQADLKNVPVGQIEERLERMFTENLPPGISATTMPALRPLLGYMASSLQQGTLAEDLENAEMEEDGDGSMDVELGEVLNVGERFSYVYDFGSSTNLSFRVIGEREGVLPADELEDDELEDDELEDGEDEDEDDELEDGEDEDEDEIAIVVMARNDPPALLCHTCGQPATHVLPESEYDTLDKAGLCQVHAKKYTYPDELLPVVNSPRVGVCGYTGDDEGDDDEDEE